MPIIDYIKDDFTEIVTWKVIESEFNLLNHLKLSPHQVEKYNVLSPKKRLEYLGVRACLLELNIESDVFYDKKGKPYLNGDKHLSISHSYGLVSVGVSKYNLGIDIEKKREKKILNIARKFIRNDEFEWIPQNENYIDYLHIIWGIKEGLFKLNGGNLWNFLHHYRVENFDICENEKILCWILDEQCSQKYYAYYKIIDSHFLIWVLSYEMD